MNRRYVSREEAKCDHLPLYKTLADAKAAVNGKQDPDAYVAYPCDCGGAHIEKLRPTVQQQTRRYIGGALPVVRRMVRRELKNYPKLELVK